MSNDITPDADDVWADDVLDRQNIGRMLETHLVSQFSKRPSSLTVALDGRWGSGKTFFVNRWTQELRNNHRGVIVFDAWQHDHASEPVLAFMAELRGQIKDLASRLIDEKATVRSIEQSMDTAIGSFKKVAVPIVKVAFSAALKKVVGAGVDEFADALSASTDEDSGVADADSSPKALLDHAVDLYLSRVLADHQEKKESLQQFRVDLERLVDSLVEAGAMTGPMFIVIDELDRCRPHFALSLLEGIKHIFNAKNVCFVFATNLEQLSASIQAIYGSSFDGRDYLGRFFDMEVRLPDPTSDQFAKLLFGTQDSQGIGRLQCGTFYFNGGSTDVGTINLWTGLCRTLNATLRQQRQAFLTLALCSESWPKSHPIPGFWLMFLSILHKARPSVFQAIHAAKPSQSGFDIKLLGTPEWDAVYLERATYPGTPTEAVSLSSLAQRYLTFSKIEQSEAVRKVRQGNDSLNDEVLPFLTGTIRAGAPTKLHLAIDLVSTAGVFVSPTSR